jgi:hypothetical protein
MFLFAAGIDLNGILNLWPYILLGGGAIGVGYGPEIYRWWKARRAAAASTIEAPPAPGSDQPVSVGTLAVYLKAIAVHCGKINDTKALAACDEIAPALFHEQKPTNGKPTDGQPAQ